MDLQVINIDIRLDEQPNLEVLEDKILREVELRPIVEMDDKKKIYIADEKDEYELKDILVRDEESGEYVLDLPPLYFAEKEVEPERLAQGISNLLKELEVEGRGKVTHALIEGSSKKITSIRIQDGDMQKKEFEKGLTSRDVVDIYDFKKDRYVNDLIQRIMADESLEAIDNIMKHAVQLQKYSIKNILLMSMYAEIRGINLSRPASMRHWNNQKIKTHLDIKKEFGEIYIYATFDPEGGIKKRVSYVIDMENKDVSLNILGENGEVIRSYKDVFSTYKSEDGKPMLVGLKEEDMRELYAYSSVLNQLKQKIYDVADKLKEGENTSLETKVGISVIKGEKSLPIFYPLIKKVKELEPVYKRDENGEIVYDENGKPVYEVDENGEIVKQEKYVEKLDGFRIGGVFDINQTTARYLGVVSPTEKMIKLFPDGIIDLDKVEKINNVIEEKFGIKIKIFEDNGFNAPAGFCAYDSTTGKPDSIEINMSVVDTPSAYMSVLFHELGHALMHSPNEYSEIHGVSEKIDKALKEMEAESFSYLINKQLGNENAETNILYMRNYLEWLKNFSSEGQRKVLGEVLKKTGEKAKEVLEVIYSDKDLISNLSSLDVKNGNKTKKISSPKM